MKSYALRCLVQTGLLVLVVPWLPRCVPSSRDYGEITDASAHDSGDAARADARADARGEGGGTRIARADASAGGRNDGGGSGQGGVARGGSSQDGAAPDGTAEAKHDADSDGSTADPDGGPADPDGGPADPDGGPAISCTGDLKLCGDHCIAESACCTSADCPTGASCVNGTCNCATGSHRCGAACVANDSPEHCGAACTACPAPTGGSATCDGTSCGATCPTGQKPCAGTCIPNANSCTGVCPSGSHDCAGVCASDSAVTSCGKTSCAPCAVPANSDATCTNGTCGFACKADYKPCGNQCISKTACCQNSDCTGGKSCTGGACLCSGACCQDSDCQANATCATSSHTCGCSTNYKACGSLCISKTACCSSTECASPPSPTCASSSVLRSSSGGSCSNGSCKYTQSNKTCNFGCQNGACRAAYPTQLAIGAGHVCALMNLGTVYCWGAAGSLGDGSNENKGTPVQVTGITNATQITAGSGTTCAVLSGGSAMCWGGQGDGQLGTGPTSNAALTPVSIPGLTGAIEIKTDGFSVCALLQNGTVRCWGRNGDASTTSYIGTISGVTSVKHLGDGNPGANCAISSDGSVTCWSGADAQNLAPVEGLSNVSQLSTQCALTSGKVLCWGSNGYGQVGDGTTTERSSPTPVQQLGGTVTQIASGGSHVCALMSDQSLKCWGKDGFFGPIDYGPYPLLIKGLGAVASVAAEASNTCVIQVDHTVQCWGGNLFSQLGNGTTDAATTPGPVLGLPNGE